MKKITWIQSLTVVSLALALTACGGNTPAPIVTPGPDPVVVAQPIPADTANVGTTVTRTVSVAGSPGIQMPVTQLSDGTLTVEGDIQADDVTAYSNSLQGKSVIYNGGFKWPEDKVSLKYLINVVVEPGSPITKGSRLANSIKSFEDAFPQFKIVNVSGVNPLPDNYVKIMGGVGCSATLPGKNPFNGGKYQGQIKLADNCFFNAAFEGVVVHEMLHAFLAKLHTQTNSNCASKITTIWDNILPAAVNNFKSLKLFGYSVTENECDLSSIMAYSEYSFSKNGKKTLDAKGVPMGQRSYVSEDDKLGVASRYPTLLADPVVVPVIPAKLSDISYEWKEDCDKNPPNTVMLGACLLYGKPGPQVFKFSLTNNSNQPATLQLGYIQNRQKDGSEYKKSQTIILIPGESRIVNIPFDTLEGKNWHYMGFAIGIETTTGGKSSLQYRATP